VAKPRRLPSTRRAVPETRLAEINEADSGGEAGATSTYVRASLSEVAAALAALTGEPHPLAAEEGW
jgi:hypothetical protein